MNFYEFSKIFSEEFSKIFSQDTQNQIQEESDQPYKPTPEEIRKFISLSKNKKPDYSKDFHNIVLRKFWTITSQISNERLRKEFSEVIYKNMGNLSELVSQVSRKNEMNPRSNKYNELRKYLDSIEGDWDDLQEY